MDQEYPFRQRGRHGFDREEVMNYISQAQQRCNEHLARMEELEAAKNAWYTQAKSMEREKAALVARNRELEEQLERGTAAPAGNEWFAQNDPMISSFPESQELAAVRARCLELEERLEEQNIQQSALESDREKALQDAAEATEAAQAARSQAEALQKELDNMRQQAGEIDQGAVTLRQELEAVQAEKAMMAKELQEKDAVMPRFTMHQQEMESMRSQLEQQVAAVQIHASHVAALEQEKAAALHQLNLVHQENFTLNQRMAALENEKTTYAAQLPALQEQLSYLAESADQISALEAAKASLAAELEAVKLQNEAIAKQSAELADAMATMQVEKDELEMRCAELSQEEAQARQKQEDLELEAGNMRARLQELETRSDQPSEETLRSMVLASFNYSNLYVDNNLKTAQFISEATSRNIGRVSDSANSLLDQVEAIGRSFNETTDTIRRNLAAFQRELGSIQSGMNRRLSKDRFASLLEENERLRTRLESELLAELSADDEEPPISMPLQQPEGAKLPFAEDLPQNFHDFLDD